MGLRSRWTGPMVAAGLVVLCLGAWATRNWRVYHVLQPLAPKYANDPGEPAPTGFARWYRTWGVGLENTSRVYWEYDGSVLSPSDLPKWAIDGPLERAETLAIYRRYNADSSSTPGVEAAFAQLARKRERAHPVRTFAVLPLARLGDMWLRPRTELMPLPLDWWQPRWRPRASLFALGYGLLNVGLLAAALAGLWRGSLKGMVGAAMLGYVALRCVLLMTIDNAEPRYVLEAYPVVLVLAAVALSRGTKSGEGAGRLQPERRWAGKQPV